MTDRINLAGVIGHPIAHSKSPTLHGHWLQRYGLSGHYVPMDVHPDDLEDVLRTLPKLGFRGINVTIPHKEDVLKLADIVTDRAAMIGAANTLTFTADGRIQADNTDGIGFLSNVKHYAPEWKPEAAPAVVLGAGGAARAIISALLGAGVTKIKIANRTKQRANVLRDHFGAKVEVIDWTQVPNQLGDAGLLVNTTSLGMVGKPELTLNLDGLKSTTVVTDIVYTPLRTPLLETAASKGCVTVDGLGMLLFQAAPGFERWFGTTPEVDDALREAILSA